MPDLGEYATYVGLAYAVSLALLAGRGAMAKFSPLLAAPPAFFAGLALMFYMGMQREDPNALPSAQIGEPAPPVTLTQLGAEPPFGDDVLRAPGVKLVNYWASWCAPCRAEHPNLVALAEEGIPIYGINYKDDPAKGRGRLGARGARLGSLRRARDLRDRRRGEHRPALRGADHRTLARSADPPGDRGGAGAGRVLERPGHRQKQHQDQKPGFHRRKRGGQISGEHPDARGSFLETHYAPHPCGMTMAQPFRFGEETERSARRKRGAGRVSRPRPVHGHCISAARSASISAFTSSTVARSAASISSPPSTFSTNQS